MYLMYVDESGDCGREGSPTSHFILSGLVIHELRWKRSLDDLIQFRRLLRSRLGLKLREEIHASELIHRSGVLRRLSRPQRFQILRMFATQLSTMTDFSLISIAVDKTDKPNSNKKEHIFEIAWRTLIQRFENTIVNRNFPGPVNPDERGMLFPDQTDEKRLNQLTRSMRRYNPIPHKAQYGPGYRNLPLESIIEDPSFRDSAHSYFIQAADLCAYLLYQYLNPCLYMRKVGARNYYINRLAPIHCASVSATNPHGIVYI
ncbi:DUF3800 domain-containing protein [Candidatus Neomarinimicrobiota bacterium]